MIVESKQDASAVMDRINQAWLDGRVKDIIPMVHQDIVMVFPGFEGRAQGREGFLAGFDDFCRNAKIHKFQEQERHTDVVGDTAVITFRYEMIYERSGKRYQSTGRDLWVFERQGHGWIAVWRTMLDMDEHSA